MNYGDYPNLSSVKRILIIKLRHLGDVLLTSPLFSILKNRMPDAEIDAFIYQESAPMLEGHPDIARLILYDSAWKKSPFVKKLFKEIQMLRSIRRRGYDLIINLTEGDRGAIISWASGAPLRVGFDPKKSGFLGKRKLYSHLVKQCPSPRHTVEKNLDAARRIGIFPSLEERDLSLFIPDETVQKMRSLLQNAGYEEGNYIVIHPTSRWRFKCLPTATIAKLIDALKKRGVKVVLTSGPDAQELSMIEAILGKKAENVLNLAGQTSLKELAALIQLSSCLFCVDSVALHIASALKTPVVAMFGPSSEKNWGPWMHPQSRVVTKSVSCRPCFMDGCGGSKVSDCLYTLSVDSILEAYEEIAKDFSLV